MGGGKIHLHFSSHRHLLRVILFLTLSSALAGCTPAKDTLCGVPVQGSPWSLAAAIYDHGDQSFLPCEVEILTPDQAYIRGWYYNPNDPQALTSGGDGFQPAYILCDIADGTVTHAALFINE